jgi:hypothetical protein
MKKKIITCAALFIAAICIHGHMISPVLYNKNTTDTQIHQEYGSETWINMDYIRHQFVWDVETKEQSNGDSQLPAYAWVFFEVQLYDGPPIIQVLYDNSIVSGGNYEEYSTGNITNVDGNMYRLKMVIETRRIDQWAYANVYFAW